MLLATVLKYSLSVAWVVLYLNIAITMASSSTSRADHIILEFVEEAVRLGASSAGSAATSRVPVDLEEKEKVAVKTLVDKSPSRADHIILELVEEAIRLGASSVGGAATSRLPVELEEKEKDAVTTLVDKLVDRKWNLQRKLQNRGVLGLFGLKVKEKVNKTKEQKAEEKEKKAKEKAEQKKRKADAKKPKTKKEIRKEICPPKLPQCYEEIVKLIEIESSPVYAKALAEWTRKETLFTNRVERKKKKVANLKNEIYQLLGFFSVFQGVLLTAVSQSNLLHCNNRWSPIVLSVVASVVTISGVYQKLVQIQGFQNTIHAEEECLKEVVDRSSNLRSTGVQKFKFAKFYEDTEKKKQSKFRHRVYFSLVIVSLGIFAVGFPLSNWSILCHPGPNPYGK